MDKGHATDRRDALARHAARSAEGRGERACDSDLATDAEDRDRWRRVSALDTPRGRGAEAGDAPGAPHKRLSAFRGEHGSPHPKNALGRLCARLRGLALTLSAEAVEMLVEQIVHHVAAVGPDAVGDLGEPRQLMRRFQLALVQLHRR